MIQTDKGYKIECSGKEIPTYGVYGFSLNDGVLRVGHDDKIGEWKDNGFDSGLTDEEKVEIAFYKIKKWSEFAGLQVVNIQKNREELVKKEFPDDFDQKSTFIPWEDIGGEL